MSTEKVRLQCEETDHLPFEFKPQQILHADKWCPVCTDSGRRKSKKEVEAEFRDKVHRNNGRVLGIYYNNTTNVEVECLVCSNK